MNSRAEQAITLLDAIADDTSFTLSGAARRQMRRVVSTLSWLRRQADFRAAGWTDPKPEHIDTLAVNTIAEVLNDADTEDGWNADHFDAIAKVLDAARCRRGADEWDHGTALVWRDRAYRRPGAP